MHSLELLAPARNAETGRTAILAGADAVYIGAPAFGARAAATNSIEDIAALTEFAHRYRARVYVTMNTILYEDELESARRLVRRLYAAGVDALIVQDMAYLMMDIPPIALHASTQCDIRTPEKAAWLAKAGFAQLVLPREFTPQQIRLCAEAAGVPVEVFVHGALCVSYSGDCHAGFAATGRSANRGECPQMCRLPYELVDAQGRAVAPKKHWLSLRDMQRIGCLAELINAGATSFKIEGRLKDARYVANVTAAYSQELNRIIAASGGILKRTSAGTSTHSFTPDLRRTFNRGYTDYFITRPNRMASVDTPKWAGMPVATVASPFDRRKGCFEVKSSHSLANGDGLGFFDSDGAFHGFRLNRADGDRLYPASAVDGLKAGMTIYRNSDKAFFDIIDRPDSCRRKIDVDIQLTAAGTDTLVLTASDCRGCTATETVTVPYEEAKSDQSSQRRKILEKTGDTIYTIGSITDGWGSRFIAASVLTEARRRLLSTLDTVAACTYRYDRRKPSELPSAIFADKAPLTYHDNIANTKAAQFYTDHSAAIGERAVEVEPRKGDTVVMTTRYCLRCELGCCLKEAGASKLPRQLFLRNESGLYRLDFDCRRCGMSVIKMASNTITSQSKTQQRQ